jgi:hypothetical protein
VEWRAQNLLADALAAQGDEVAADVARDQARTAVIRVANGIEDPDLGRGYREEAVRASLLARPRQEEGGAGPSRRQT